ncbi:hypothetical protein D8674_031052 [Pyrus ussuriensis x Pyrus communis]|uniref:Uncharacterized protein n=1 Tax=Pyrus ussuriensis x Pyrus communis TaxID=2448454 RepID=A0A5N5F2W2_9ROSA|nr:hypothetical protein D8674_031052 [Pyrus ussuriensis x Pyrus communis]
MRLMKTRRMKKHKNLTRGIMQQRKKRQKNGGLNSKYKLRGFALAFQAWAFECFPGFQKLNHVVMNHIPKLPRILHWHIVKDEEKNVGLWPYGTTKSPRNTDASGNHDVGFDCDVGIPDLLMPQGYDFGVWHQHLKKLTDYVTNLGKENHVLKKMESFSELNHKIRVAYAFHGDSMHPSNEPDEDPQYHPTAKSQMPVALTNASGNHDVRPDGDVDIPNLSMPQGYDIGVWHQHLQNSTDYVTNLGHENHVLKPKVAYLERKNQEVEEALRVKLDKFDIKNQGRLLKVKSSNKGCICS